MSDISRINLLKILRIKRHKYFDEILPENIKLNNIMHMGIRDLMPEALKNESKEALLIIQDKNIKKYRICTSDKYNSIKIPDDIKAVMQDGSSKFIMVHNHPNNSIFSLRDIRTLIEYDCLCYIGVITNNCKNIILACVNEQDEFTRFDMLEYIDNNENNKDNVSIIKDLYSMGLVCRVYKNY